MTRYLGLSFIFLLLAACSKNPSVSTVTHEPTLVGVLTDVKATWSEKRAYFFATTTGSSTWHKRWWIEKTARLLRGGDGIGPADRMEDLLKLDEAAIIQQFMADDRFGDTLLDFNMYFLGFKNGSLKSNDPKSPGKYLDSTFDLSNAIQSAQETQNGGDYFKLFDLRAPMYIARLGNAFSADPADANLPSSQVRQRHVKALQDDLQQSLVLAKTEGSTTAQVCKALEGQNQLVNGLLSSGFPLNLILNTLLISPDGYFRLESLCGKKPAPPVEEVATAIEVLYGRNQKIFAAFTDFEPELYNPVRVADFKSFQPHVPGFSDQQLAFSFEQSQALQNSSTNYNRKRAAYVLKHYFCDDLNPVGVEANDPTAHTGGPHGSETSCMACHYKLDPMAGFFRDYGFFFSDFSKAEKITLDDQVVVDRDKYESTWKAPAGAGRVWDVGYIRSESSPSDNMYGESIDDLSRIIHEAPEVKRCLVKRMFEYFIAENQTVDAGYLRGLADDMANEATTSNSSVAVKKTISRLLTSGAYNEGNLDPAKCYDVPTGTQPNGPPCRVAFLFQSYCKDCHHDSGDQKYGSLDLTKWIAAADGQMTFPHEDELGQQRDRGYTMSKIAERLSTSDPDHRMPYKKTIPSQDRQELYLWAQSMLNGGH